jgi:hypothetical protein
VDSKVGSDLRGCRSEPIDRHGLGGSALLIHPAGSGFLVLRVFTVPPEAVYTSAPRVLGSLQRPSVSYLFA